MDLKTLISPEYIERIADALARVDGLSTSDVIACRACALDGLHELELKARVEHVRDALSLALRGYEAFADRLDVVLALPNLASLGGDTSSSFELWPLTSWVAHEGMDEPELALDALVVLTRRFTAEFDVRPFLAHHRALTLEHLVTWRDSRDHHDRRLVSEGTRAYLPWGKQVTWLRDEPEVVLALITPLRDDPSEYVRRSVANNINDMTRRHADWVVEQLEPWVEDAPEARMWVVRHALRSLVKKGHAGALELLGFSTQVCVDVAQFSASTHVVFGGKLALTLELESMAETAEHIVLDFAIHHVKANGTRTRKVFKWKTFELAAGDTLTLTRSHAIKPISTRRYFAGTHKVDVLLNGACVAAQEFELVMDEKDLTTSLEL